MQHLTHTTQPTEECLRNQWQSVRANNASTASFAVISIWRYDDDHTLVRGYIHLQRCTHITLAVYILDNLAIEQELVLGTDFLVQHGAVIDM